MKDLEKYFSETRGWGILSTADSRGHVNSAIYARPHIMEDGTIAFIMANRLSHNNLESNSHAVYLFKEDGNQYKGKRLYLTKVREEEETELLYSLKRRKYPPQQENSMKPLFLVFFRVDQERPLIGS